MLAMHSSKHPALRYISLVHCTSSTRHVHVQSRVHLSCHVQSNCFIRRGAPGRSSITSLRIFLGCALFLFICPDSVRRTDCSAQPITDVSYQIEEELDIGSYVGNILHSSRLSDVYSAEVLSTLQFRFLKQYHAAKFLLDGSTGVLRTGNRIDRDSLCPGAETCGLRLDVAVQPAQYFRIIRVTVNITDINDNEPR